MKVLHVEAGMHLYGGALQVVFLLRGLKARGIDCVLACPTGSAIAAEAAPHAQVVEMTMRGAADMGLTGRLRRLIRAVKPDVVHLHSRRGSDLWGALAGRLEGVPVVLSRRVDNPEARWVVSLKYRLYDEVVTISDGIHQVLLSEGVPPAKVHCVLSAVDTERYRPDRSHLAWFRQTFGAYKNSDAIIMLVGFRKNRFKFGYSYDFTVSDGRSAIPSSHEVSATIDWCVPPGRTPFKPLRCPEF